jgi:cysteine desulfuration protein SufE
MRAKAAANKEEVMLATLDQVYDKLRQAKDAEEEARKLGLDGFDYQAYKELMALGEKLESFPEEDMIPENRVAKCQSTVYITGRLDGGKMLFKGCSDAAFVRGELAILIGAMSGLSPCEVVTSKAKVGQFVERLKGIVTISLIRGEGFLGMYEKMREISCQYCQTPEVQVSQ